MSLDKAILHGKEIGNHISEENLLIVLAEIMGIVTGAKITDYMHLRYRKKLLMRSWQNMRKEEVDEKVVLYIYVVANGYIRNNWLYIPKR